MLIAYDSLTGNVRRFAQALQARCGLPLYALPEVTPDAPCLLLTYTFGRGEVPERTRHFLERHGHALCGVVASGSYHFGPLFAAAGERIAAEFGVPLIARINKAGTAADLARVATWLEERTSRGTLD